ncbi:MAG: Holliday junction branch migration protein RuvA [Muribaculaceae bacterium]|jgi:Holliday junction DNA helicase RuvA
MLEYIRGEIATLNPAVVVLETRAGLAYLLHISLSTFSALENSKDAKLFVHEVIRDDAWLLYGFAAEREREIFRSLIGVSGVGAATAIIILSSFSPDELAQTIASGDVKRLKSVKGIGAKTAERIIVDLRDKIKPADDTLLLQPQATSDAFDEALAALTMLGFDRKHSQKVLKQLFDAVPAIKVEQAIKQALTMM